MKCTKAQSLMHDFLDHHLADEELGPFLDHIENCPDCREELELYSTVFELLGEENVRPAKERADSKAMLQEKLNAGHAHLRRVRTVKVLQYLSVALLLTAFVVLLYFNVLLPFLEDGGMGGSPEVTEYLSEQMSEEATEALSEQVGEEATEPVSEQAGETVTEHPQEQMSEKVTEEKK